MGICGRPRSGCDPSTNHGSRPDASGPRTAPRGALAAGTGLQAPPAPRRPRAAPAGGRPSGLARAGRGLTMTPDRQPASNPVDQPHPERPADLQPAWERIAYTWLEREVDAGQPIDPGELAKEVSVAPGLARDLVRVLRAERDRDPTLSELRGRLVR